jgi:F-type H+-transporting ATPase subunit gamma
LKLLPVEARDGIEKDENEVFEFINYEPSPEEVLSFIIPKYIASTVYGGLIESAAAEQAARRVAMENASNNADEMIDELTLTYNQARQAAITQEIAEIVGGAEALK